MKEIRLENAVFFIGQNCKENDELYHSMPMNAIWFHLDANPSAHIYLITEKKTKELLKQGAMLIRSNSKGQGKVIYLERKYLKLIGQGLVEMTKEPKRI